MKKATALLLLGLSATACRQDSSTTEDNTAPPPAQPAPGDTFDPAPHPMDVGMGGGTVVPISPDDLTAPPARKRRRMDIDQLNASIRRTTGGIGWTDGNNADQFQLLSATLGKPDFLQNTMEDLDPSPLFLKFLDDAARSVCDKLVAREMPTGAHSSHALLIHASMYDTLTHQPENVDKNLRALILRYHGRSVPAAAPELEPWRFLFASVMHVNGSTTEAWRAVCVALINHPDFYSY